MSVLRRIGLLFRSRNPDHDLEEELRSHIEMRAQDNLEAGMSAEDARLDAMRRFGNETLIRERTRAAHIAVWLESALEDIRYGLRTLSKSSEFSTVAILTLALGIGAATAIFSIVNAILLRPLPFRDSERFVHISTTSPLGKGFPDFATGESIPDFDDINSQSRSFETMAMCQGYGMNLSDPGEPEEVNLSITSHGFLSVFGIRPQLGRDFRPDDEHAKTGNVALIGHDFWQRKFSGDPNILGRKMVLDKKVYTIIGVLPPGFEFPQTMQIATDVLVPVETGGRQDRGVRYLPVLAKLKLGTTLRTAQAELDGIASRLASQYPKEDSGLKFNAVPLREEVTASAKSKLLVLLGAVGFLLMIAFANVSNLILSRGVQRQREIAVRAALGASRRRIVRQLLVESLILACAGGVAGLLIAAGGIEAFKVFAPKDVPRLSELHLDPAMAWFGLLISSFAGLVCGLAPSLHASRSDLVFALKDRTATSIAQGSRQVSLRSILVVSEVALALVLLAGSALLAQSLVRMLRVDPGFRTDHLLTAWLSSAAPRYSTEEASQMFLRQMLDELHARPELSRAAMSSDASMNGMVMMQMFDPRTLGLAERPLGLETRSVDPGYFETMGIPLRSGRVFTEHDTAAATPVVVINEAVARHYFSGKNPLGRTLKLGAGLENQPQIIGIVADVRDVHIKQSPRPQFYSALLQRLQSVNMMVYIRTKSDDPEQLASALQRSVRAVDKDVRVTGIQSMTAVIGESVAEPRFRTWLLNAFALAGLILTLIGIYGVISYSVEQRTHELGVRIALGAQASNVLRLVLNQGVRLALLGAAIGLLGSLALMRLLRSQLYEIKPGDPLTLAGAVVLMLAVAICASYLPARRASRVDPMIALRHE